METSVSKGVTLASVREAAKTLKWVSLRTPLSFQKRYSDVYSASILFKREDLQSVRSYKIRGAYHKIQSLSSEEKKRGIVCASAGNHAQGVALSCKLLAIDGTIVMPTTTPQQKIEQVQMFGESFVNLRLEGDTFDDAQRLALTLSEEYSKTFIPPFDDAKIIEGQATVALEILEQIREPIDYLFVPIGGGGLAAGVCTVFQELMPETKIIGVEPQGAAAMKASLEKGENTPLKSIDKFVDGAAVHRVGDLNFSICKEGLHDVVAVAEGSVCQTLLDLYHKEAIIVEPAGAMSIAALEPYAERIRGKNVVCVISGGNNDIMRTGEIKERALLHAQLKHYFIVKFPQRAGALRQFLDQILDSEDDITHFEYTKKTNRENGAAVVGIEISHPSKLQPLISRMKANGFYGDYLNSKPELFQFLV
ncbi:threonine ammonia-lyase IlvA [Altibacter sp. HG106]|uniref:threonine ammonia-lyase IlvA n=1 Tax=Altibacter sp. HG106 TaxID=3023937 RepID=UPI0023507FD7|nr:threonine ammonia-lyase IlvA [Altibacter sp. HG106]MDC7994372.1 threonine ammonia-lyase IlvA [Altibacter sp. HG106]